MEFSKEQQIIHQLLLKSGEENNIGLCNGKMGLVLFFVHYSKITCNPIYEDIADELMNEITREIHNYLPIGFDSGLSGIGWGIEYLIQKRFLKGNSLEICEEIDKKIMEKDPRRMIDYSIETGLGGIFHYVLAHIKGVKEGCDSLPFDNNYLHDLSEIALCLSSNPKMSTEMKDLCECYTEFYKNGKPIDYSLKISNFTETIDLDEKKLNKYPIGLKNGLVGILFFMFNFFE